MVMTIPGHSIMTVMTVMIVPLSPRLPLSPRPFPRQWGGEIRESLTRLSY